MLFDTHSHIHFPAFDPDRPEAIRRAREAGVGDILVVGTSADGSRAALEVAREHGLLAAAGIHPGDAERDRGRLPGLAALLDDDRVAAVGETGLDYTCEAQADCQRAVFRSLLDLAADRGRPVIVHSREAAADTLALLREAAASDGGALRGVWHCFSGDEKIAAEALALGLHISFTGNITYRKNVALRRVAAMVPLDRLLLETDCPFMPPEGRRGKRNEPAWLALSARAIAAARNEDAELLARETTANGHRLFGRAA